MYDFLENNLLIICPNSYKMAILKYLSDNKLLLNIKFMAIDEYKKSLYFDYDIKTIHYLASKGMKIENTISLLDNLYYIIEDKKYHNEKLDYLVSIKHELDENNLLIYDHVFPKFLKRKKVVVYGYGRLNSFNAKMFKNCNIIAYPEVLKKHVVYHFDNLDEEVEFVFQKIIDLLNNGVDINNISLMNVTNEYLPIIKRMEEFYQIKVEEVNSDTLMGTIMGESFYDLILKKINKEEIVEKLSKFNDQEDYDVIINLINQYHDFDLFEVKDEIKYELLNKKISSKKMKNVIKIKNIFDYVFDDEYVFLMNFNNDSIPNLLMDTDYITNNIKDLVGLVKVEDENVIIKENTINYLNNINNLIISYKDKSPFNTYYPSILLDEIDYEESKYTRSNKYSNKANQSLYTKYLDDYVKYGYKNNDLDLFYKMYDKNNYLDYDNQFTGINNDKLIKYLNNELTLSYSSVDNFYKCGFKYYLSNILKIDLFEETFYAVIGSLFHYCLSKMNEDDFDLEKEYYEYVKDKEFTNKEKFFLDKLKKDLIFIIETLKKHQFISGFSKMLYEQKIDIKLQDSPYVHFKGFVDKIMYEEKNNETLVSIIDYKTGNPDVKIKNLQFGLSMQLPVYLYLVNNSNILRNIKFTGFYLQHILNINLKKNDKKTREEQNYDNLKLQGYSTNDLNRLSIFDSTYENSEMIRGMKLTKDGEISKQASILSDDEIKEILDITHEKIINAMNNILEGNFFINPKIIDNKNVSCEYCSFKDICYHEEKNNIYLKENE